MARIDGVQSIEITLASGKVLHFKAAFGDTLVVSEITTQPTGTSHSAPMSVNYYYAVITPGKESPSATEG